MWVNALIILLSAAFVRKVIVKKLYTEKMLAEISNEGYETAMDILFPEAEDNTKLHYGPVISAR